jgi:hypothetical protein
MDEKEGGRRPDGGGGVLMAEAGRKGKREE